MQRGDFGSATRLTVREVSETWLTDIRSGLVRNGSGTAYKPSVVRSYTSSYWRHLDGPLGHIALSKLRRRDIQALIDGLALELDDYTVRNAMSPLRAICRYAVTRELIPTNPCQDIELPQGKGRRFATSEHDGKRETIATPAEAATLIDVLADPADRSIWATAFYAGLRRGELRGLFVSDVDLEARTISVRRAWDALEGEIDPKSYNSVRVVPISDPLMTVLMAYLADHDNREFAFPGFGRWKGGYGPFSADALLKRSRKTWRNSGLAPIGLHEARHTYASTMIQAGVPLPKVSRYMGHSSISVTERVYFHLLPKAHEADLATINAYFRER